MPIKVACPGCAKHLVVDRRLAATPGAAVCPACGARLRFENARRRRGGGGPDVAPTAGGIVTGAEAQASPPAGDVSAVPADEDFAPAERSAAPWVALGAVIAAVPLLVVLGVVLSRSPRPAPVASLPAVNQQYAFAPQPPPAAAAAPTTGGGGTDRDLPPTTAGAPRVAGVGALPTAHPDADAQRAAPSTPVTTRPAGPPATTAPPPPPDDAPPEPDGGENPAAAATPDGPPEAETPPPPPATRPARRAVAARPPVRPVPLPRPLNVSDEEIDRAIRLGIDGLAARFNGKTGIVRPQAGLGNTTHHAGVNALAVYALLQAGLAVSDERLHPRGGLGAKLLNGTKKMRINGGPETYTRAVRANCLALFNRPEDRDTLEVDVRCLLIGHSNGSYTYESAPPSSPPPPSGGTSQPDPAPAPRSIVGKGDNSNSQYGVLGVWAGAEAGAQIPEWYWEQIEQHWVGCQLDDGTWDYTTGMRGSVIGAAGGLSTGTPTMTAAGLATLFVVRDQLDFLRGEAPVGRPPFSPELEKGLRWWESGTNSVEAAVGGYGLYGVERVGLASGFKYFGRHDWFRVLAGVTVGEQEPDGCWGDTVETAFKLLFLSRGRHPILMNKLRFDGFWANRPRDAANLARYAARKLERELNWQVVGLKHEWHDWLDAPILSIASHEPIRFGEKDYEKFRQYVRGGGMVFTQSDGDSEAFEEWVVEFAKKLFPQYEFQDLPAEHPLYSCVFRFKNKPPRLRVIVSGSRILMLHSPADIAEAWQLRKEKDKEDLFQLGTNIFVYAAGRRDLRNRLDSPYVPAFKNRRPPLATVKVARLRYAGNWDPEPGAWERYARLFEFRTGTRLQVTEVKWKDLDPAAAPFAHLTGSARHDPTDAEVVALRAYVEGGGVLLIDDCGGSGAFTGGLADAIAQAFPGRPPSPVATTHPLLRLGGAGTGMLDLTGPQVRTYAAERGFKNVLPQIVRAGDGAVVLSRLDVVSGLLGTNTWGITGYTSKYAENLVQNLVLWTLDGLPED